MLSVSPASLRVLYVGKLPMCVLGRSGLATLSRRVDRTWSILYCWGNYGCGCHGNHFRRFCICVKQTKTKQLVHFCLPEYLSLWYMTSEKILSLHIKCTPLVQVGATLLKYKGKTFFCHQMLSGKNIFLPLPFAKWRWKIGKDTTQCHNKNYCSQQDKNVDKRLEASCIQRSPTTI